MQIGYICNTQASSLPIPAAPPEFTTANEEFTFVNQKVVCMYQTQSVKSSIYHMYVRPVKIYVNVCVAAP